MDKVDIYNNKHILLNYSKGRKELSEDEFRLSCFAWIINDKNEILIQQRLEDAKTCPNMWETASGGACLGEDALAGVKRELNEELGISVDEDDIRFIGSFARVNDFVEVFLLKTNVDVSDLSLQEDEVQRAKWVDITDFEKMIECGQAVDTSFSIFKEYMEKYYNRYLVFENNRPVYKSRGK